MIRNEVDCYKTDGETVYKRVTLPDVFSTLIRPEVVRRVHRNVGMNGRQPHAVDWLAGMRHSAHSWGTGRALARVCRVSGGGTRRAGQGAFANFCRKGRMAWPTKVYRKWQRMTPVNERRLAAAIAVAATACAPLVESRGHRISELKQIPLVVSDAIQSVKRTADALSILGNFKLAEEVDRVKSSVALRAGKGKARNRRWIMRKGLLIVYAKCDGLTKAFGNLPGVELMQVDSLDILKLAPGSHLGRLVLWTESAFERLRVLFGETEKEGTAALKAGFTLSSSKMACPDYRVTLASEEVKALFNKKPSFRPGKTLSTRKELEALNPYFQLFSEISL